MRERSSKSGNRAVVWSIRSSSQGLPVGRLQTEEVAGKHAVSR